MFLEVLRFAERQRRSLLLLVGLVTLGLGAGWSRLRLETGLLDWLPEDHPNVEAFQDLFTKLGGAVSQELLWLEIDPAKARVLGVDEVTSHGGFQAQAELVDFVRERVPEVQGSFGLLALLEQAGRLSHVGGSSSGVPDAPWKTRLLWSALRALGGQRLEAFADEERQGTVLSLIVDTEPLSLESRRIGLAIEAALDEYAASKGLQHDLFRDEFLVPAGLGSGLARVDQSLRDDLRWLAPLAFGVLALLLLIVLRNLRVVLVTLAILSVGVVWTLGLMGWCGSPLNVVNMAIVPLVLGCGVNYSILIGLELAEAGDTVDERVAHIARGAALGVLMTTLTTTAGLCVLASSSASGLRSLGGYAAFGMASLAFLAVLVLPFLGARFTLQPSGERGRWMATLACGVRRRRALCVGLLVLASLVSVWIVRDPVLSVDTVEGNFPADAAITRTLRRMRERCDGAFPEFVILRGRVDTPEAIDALSEIADRIGRAPEPLSTFRCIGLPELLAWTQGARDGTISERVDELWTSPLTRPLAGMFVDRQHSIATLLLIGGEVASEAREVERLYEQLEEVTAGVDRPGQFEVSFLGYRTMAWLFTENGARWLERAGQVSLALVALLSLVFFRSLRAACVALAVVGVGGLLWFALLDLVGIYLSVFLLFPLVFLLAVGSDYSLHLLCKLWVAGEPADRVWRGTGRAIAIAALTDCVIFLLFAPVELLTARQVVLAVALAVVAVTVTTALIVPSFGVPKNPH